MLNKGFRIGILILCLLANVGVTLGETVVSSEYFPLVDGNFWTYSVDGPEGSHIDTLTVLPGTTSINGVATKAVRDSNGDIAYFTSDKNGIRLYRFLFPAEGTLNLNPPIVMALGTMDLPFSLSSSGLAEFTIEGSGTFPLNYSFSTTFTGKETITVPAGTFETIKTEDVLRIFGDILGQPFDETETSTTWHARYIGEVKFIDTDSDGSEISVLLSTNVRPPPLIRPFSLPWTTILLE